MTERFGYDTHEGMVFDRTKPCADCDSDEACGLFEEVTSQEIVEHANALTAGLKAKDERIAELERPLADVHVCEFEGKLELAMIREQRLDSENKALHATLKNLGALYEVSNAEYGRLNERHREALLRLDRALAVLNHPDSRAIEPIYNWGAPLRGIRAALSGTAVERSAVCDHVPDFRERPVKCAAGCGAEYNYATNEWIRAVEGQCQHQWVDPTNPVVQANGYELCVKCGRLKEPVVEGRFTCLDCDAPIPEHGYCAPCIEKMRELIDDPVVEKRGSDAAPVRETEAEARARGICF